MTTVVEEEPFAAVVVDDHHKTTCAKCFATTDEPAFPTSCEGCHFVHYCGKKCQKKDIDDHTVECQLLQNSNFPVTNIRLVSRMLLRAARQPEFQAFNEHTWNSLTDNIEINLDNPEPRFQLGTNNIQLTEAYMGDHAPSKEELVSAWKKMLTNSFPILGSDLTMTTHGKAVYIGISRLKHSCRPDCFLIWDGAKMILRTTEGNVEYSDELTINRMEYVEWILPQCTAYRRAMLKTHGYVDYCNCEECRDTERDAERLSGLCQFCREGSFLLDNPICNKSDCKERATDEQVEKVKKVNDLLSSQLLKSHEGISSPGVEFNDYSKVLAAHNCNLYGLAGFIAVANLTTPNGSAFCAYHYIDKCFSIFSNDALPPGHLRSAFYCFRLKAFSLVSERSIDQKIVAAEEALEEVMVTHENNPLAATVENKLDDLLFEKARADELE